MSSGARYILASVACFSFVNLLVKHLSHLPFEQLVFWRGFVCLFITYGYLKHLKLHVWGVNKKWLIIRGVVGTLALSFFFYSIQHMPLASAVTIQYLSPVFTVILAGLFFGETVSGRHWLCSLIGFVGVWIIQGFDDRVTAFAATMGVLGALSSALAYNSVRTLKDSDHEWVVMFYFPLIATVISAPVAFSRWIWPQGWDWFWIVVLGVLVQIAQLFLTRGYSREKASAVASVNYAGVLLATIYGVALFNEHLPPATIIGMVVILVSVWLSSSRVFRSEVAVKD